METTGPDADLTPLDIAVAAALRGKRAERNVSYDVIVQRTNISRSSVIRYFTAKRAIPVSRFIEIANAIGVEPGKIVQAAIDIAALAEQEERA